MNNAASISDFFIKLENNKLIKGLPNWMDDGSMGDDIVMVHGMWIKDETGAGRMYYDSPETPVFNTPEFRKYFGKINRRFYSYALDGGKYGMITYGEVLNRKINPYKASFFNPTSDVMLKIDVRSQKTIPDYGHSKVINIQDRDISLYDSDILNSVNLLYEPKRLREYLIDNRPVSIEQIIENSHILKFPHAVKYLCDKHTELNRLLTPLQRKFKIANLADL
jgi:hypothetical protein